jgi:hypothetical protein
LATLNIKDDPALEEELSNVQLEDNPTAIQLIQQLHSFQGCTDEAHSSHDNEHAQMHPKAACNALSDLLDFQKPNSSIPNVLSEPNFPPETLTS